MNIAITKWSPQKVEHLRYLHLGVGVAKTASLLQSMGVKKGDPVLLWGPNSRNWVIAFFSILRIGAIVVPLDASSHKEFVRKVLFETRPVCMLISEDLQSKLPSEQFRYRPKTVLILEQLQDEIKDARPVLFEEVSAEDIAEIVFTSGSTGAPKGVVLTHGNIISNVEALLKVVNVKSSFRFLSILPLSHMFGMTIGLLAPLASGARVIFLDSILPSSIKRAMSAEQATCMVTIPEALLFQKRLIEQEIAKAGKKKHWEKAYRLSHLLPLSLRKILFRELHRQLGGKFDFFICGGARLDPILAEFFERQGIKLIQGYGMTEASPVVSCDSLIERDHKTVGKILSNIEVKISEDGEVLVRGPNIMKCYWQNNQATFEVIDSEGWYHTGDIGALSGNRLRLFDRNKYKIALSSGLNVYPADVEMVLKQQDGVRDAVVYGHVSDIELEVHAILLMAEGADYHRAVKDANSKLAPYQKVRGYKVWSGSDFPRTPALKPKREEIIKSING